MDTCQITKVLFGVLYRCGRIVAGQPAGEGVGLAFLASCCYGYMSVCLQPMCIIFMMYVGIKAGRGRVVLAIVGYPGCTQLCVVHVKSCFSLCQVI